jgi:pyruvate kinase
MSRTKIVATLGPATKKTSTIRQIINLGVDIFRVNFSHGNKEEHAEIIGNIRKAAGAIPVAIMGDLAGPKLRCGRIEKEPALLKKGNILILTTRNVPGNSEAVSVNHKQLPHEIKPGEHIYLDDGNIELEVKKIRGTEIHCRIINGGRLRSNKGINLPHTTLSLPAVTSKDKKMIEFGIEQGLDFFALSFVKNARDMQEAKRFIHKSGADIPLIAKIEKHEAIDHLSEIVEEAYGVMVARGDLGIEIPLEDVPIIQKRIIGLCNERGKPVITATQMMESMIENPRPTRAEVTDIANAIIDGTDAMMLSGETAVGKYPLRAVEIMDNVAQSVEKTLDYNIKLSGRSLAETGNIPDAISLATCHIAQSLNVAAILCCSATGYTARFVARYRPSCPILVFTPEPKTHRRLNLTWGVVPFLIAKMSEQKDITGFESIVNRAIEIAREKGYVRKGQRVVITAGLPLGIDMTTNMLRILEV